MLSGLVGQVSEDGEDREAGQHAGECVGQRDDDRVSVRFGNFLSLFITCIVVIVFLNESEMTNLNMLCRYGL